MKSIRKITFLIVLAVFAISSTGCFGSFGLTKKVYTWNDNVSSSKFVKTIVFWGINIIPVYGVAGMLDLVIFNLIEFWTGSNPVAMVEGEWEFQIVEYEGKHYELSASKNIFNVAEITEDGVLPLHSFKFDAESKSISLDNDSEEVLMAYYTED
jgi:hypothetical protein